MADSRDLAALIGPALVVVTASEALNLRIFDSAPPFFVYFNGMILFVAGLAIIRAHNRWTLNWTVLVTLVGWVLAAMGLSRLFAPGMQAAVPDAVKLGLIGVLLAAGIILSVQGYRRHHTQP